MATRSRRRAGQKGTDLQTRSGPLLEELAGFAHAVARASDLPATYRALFAFANLVSPTTGIFVALYDPARRLRTCVYGARDDGEDDVSVPPPMPISGSELATARAAVARRRDGARDLPLHVRSGDVLIERAPAALRAVLGAAVA